MRSLWPKSYSYPNAIDTFSFRGIGLKFGTPPTSMAFGLPPKPANEDTNEYGTIMSAPKIYLKQLNGMAVRSSLDILRFPQQPRRTAVANNFVVLKSMHLPVRSSASLSHDSLSVDHLPPATSSKGGTKSGTTASTFSLISWKTEQETEVFYISTREAIISLLRPVITRFNRTDRNFYYCHRNQLINIWNGIQ